MLGETNGPAGVWNKIPASKKSSILPPPNAYMVEWKMSAMKPTANQKQEQTMVS